MSKETIPPTLEEVTAYLATRGCDTDSAEAFYDHHEARGWMLGKVRMVSWTAACRTWARNERKFNPPSSPVSMRL